MENFNQAQQTRIQMFEKMGIKNARNMVSETSVANGTQNMSMLQKIQQIKSGAAKSELNKYVQATGKNANSSTPGVANFDPIPVSKPRKNPNMPQQQVSSDFKVNLADFGGGSSSHVDNSELSMLDNMFGGGDSRGSVSSYGNSFDNGQSFMPQRPQDTQLSLDNMSMPSFNPEHAIQRAKAKAQGNSFLQFAQNEAMGSHEDYIPQDPYANRQPQNANIGITPAMKMMMETIAKTMAEQTIKKVLTEFTDNQKSKRFYEVYNKEQSIIKTSDGKLYKLTPVQVKR